MDQDQPDTEPSEGAEAPKPAEAAPAEESFWSRNRTTIIAGGITVVAIALIITGLSAFSSPSNDSVAELEGSNPGVEGTADDLYEQAVDAEASGETSAAVDLLQRVIALDPLHTGARDMLAGLTSDTSQASGSADDAGSGDAADDPDPADPGNGTDPPPDDDAFLEPVENLGFLLPASVDGYSLGTPVIIVPDATVSGAPGGGTSVSNAVWAVHDLEKPDTAEGFITSVSKTVFSHNATDLTIDGAPAYFGTNGERFASVAYVRGRYVFEVILTAGSGAPGGLLAEAEAAAIAFPDTIE